MAGREPFNVTARAPEMTTAQRSPWHSPVPYLFGGLAAMLGLIAFALLILACSYWRLSGNLENHENGSERDLEAGEGDESSQKIVPVFEEKILVIMAGDAKPTFLATPMSSRSSSFGDNTNNTCSCSQKTEKWVDVSETTADNKQGNSDGSDQHQVQVTDENGESAQEASDHSDQRKPFIYEKKKKMEMDASGTLYWVQRRR
ncbi:protein GLUTAMINE DUMPER 3 isoform X1 [Pyrus x bretschneideri]|uniref:protein GLUTAMINE DUMPER 3 isoform X1 n=1 Tax=Pyrus x bretschneideri TaxID=225117 RepID=UPI000510AF1D|nr:protein GLUTAMINE DUMPER 3 isoform X1 [Pyrus x bretschneideri]